MSLVASRTPESKSQPYDILAHLRPNSAATSAPSSSTVLKDMLASASKMPFGEPVGKNNWAINSGVREIAPGPRSPKMNGKRALSNGHINGNGNGDAHESEGAGSQDSGDEDDGPESPSPSKPVQVQAEAGPSTSRMIGPMPPTPSRKGKEPATNGHSATPISTPRKARSLYEDPIELSWPMQMRNRKPPAAGLYNPSMACYANATLQVLLHTPPVLRIAQAHNTSDCRQARQKGWCMLCALKKLAAGDHWTSRKAYAPKEVHNHLNLIKKGFSKNRQEDTHEFFRFVTDALQDTALCGLPKDLPAKVKHTTWVYQTWGGEVRSRVVCSKCKKPSDTFDNFLDLSLDVPKGPRSITTMLQGFIKEDRLEGDNKYNCENCKSKANAIKSFKILHAPPILTLHLKRFSVNYTSYGKPRANKNTQFIEYPESLDIAPYMVDPNETNTRYRLFGVTCHRGAELRFGHYTSYVRGPQGAWFHADDEDMTAVSLSQVLKENSAYLLSYVRVGDNNPATQSVPTSAKSSPLRANGHAANMTPSAVSSPPAKRKRQWTEDEVSDKGTPVTKYARRSSEPTPPPSDDDDDEYQNESPKHERPLNKWTYGGSKSKFKANKNQDPGQSSILAPRAQNPESLKRSPIDRPSHPSPGGSVSDSPRRGKKDKMRRKQKGAPMPFKQSHGSRSGLASDIATGGFGNRKKPMSSMKPRQQNKSNRMFRG